jgi:hypothetical protein
MTTDGDSRHPWVYYIRGNFPFVQDPRELANRRDGVAIDSKYKAGRRWLASFSGTTAVIALGRRELLGRSGSMPTKI